MRGGIAERCGLVDAEGRRRRGRALNLGRKTKVLSHRFPNLRIKNYLPKPAWRMCRFGCFVCTSLDGLENYSHIRCT